MNNRINVAIIGAGNCASSLIQGVNFYRKAKANEFVPGLMHVNLGEYHVSDIHFVAAFDIDRNKVGKDRAEAIFTSPNNTYKFCDVPSTGVTVQRGMTHDGLGKYLSQVIQKAPGQTADIVKVLKESKTNVVVNFLPVGSEEATKWYIEQVLAAGCAFVNCIPVFIAREKYWQERFLERTYQLNFGGNMDFYNMLERERLESKKISKTTAVTSQLDYELDSGNIHVGPSDYVTWLADRKFCHVKMEGQTFGNVPLNLELKLEVWDSPNSAGVVIDAIRCAKLALDRGLKGALTGPSAYFMKSPPVQYTDDEARRMVEEYIEHENPENEKSPETQNEEVRAKQ
jgi:myo-inositol-1-phosphate synthase